MKHLMSGNEATARGVYEAGIKICSAYPGTPSTEILENLPPYQKDVYCEWAPNEKVAVEVAYGASIAGSRSFCTMKMVGLNVAADPLFTAGYMGVGGGFVVVTAEVDQVMFGRTIHAASFVIAFLLTMLFTVLVMLAMRRKLARVDMVESLKSNE